MAGEIVKSYGTAILTATASGYITVADATKFRLNAYVWLSAVGQANKYCIITDLDTATNTLGISFVEEYSFINYARDNVSAYAGGRIDMLEQLVYNVNDFSNAISGGGTGSLPPLGQATMANSLPVVIASNQSAIPVTGTITATNPSVGSNNAAAPTSSTQIGGWDGTNLRQIRVFNLDNGAGTQYVMGVGLRFSASGGSVEAGTDTDPLRIDPTGTTTQPVSGTVTANQGGTWNISNITGTVSLPTGAATETTLSGVLTTTAFQARINTLGQKTMANSTPVVLSSDQSAVPATQSGTWNINNITGTVSLPTGAATETTLSTLEGKIPSLGQFPMAGSLPVVIASNQTEIPVVGIASDNTTNSTEKIPVIAALANTSAPTWTNGNMVPLSVNTSGLLRVDASGSTVPVSQSGTWNVNNITGTVSLPTGAATETTLAGVLTTTAFQARINTLGQKTMANSTPVVLSSDQSAIPINDNGGSITVDGAVTVSSLPAPTNQTTSGSITAAGQTITMTPQGVGNTGLQITGTWVGTIEFEATINGTDWFPIITYGTGISSLAFTNTTTNLTARVVCAGTTGVRARSSSWTSGTASITFSGVPSVGMIRANVTQNAYTSTVNSSTTTLGIGGTFTGSAENCISTMGIQVSVFTSHDSAFNGLSVEQSQDGTNWDLIDAYTVLANEGFSRTIQSVATYVRVRYTNGGTAQTTFRLQTVLVPMVEAVPRSVGREGGLLVESPEKPTFTVTAPAVILGNNKSMLSLALASGNPRALRLREIYLRNAQITAVTGVIVQFDLFRFTSHSGGTSLTPQSRDSLDVLNAGITARTGSTITGEAAAADSHWEWSSDDWGAGTLDVESYEHGIQVSKPVLVKRDPIMKPPTIRGGEGYHIKCSTNTTAGSWDIVFIFTVEI